MLDWLDNIDMKEYFKVFQKNHITGYCLIELSEEDLKKELGIVSVGHRKVIMKNIYNLKLIYGKN